MPYKWSEVKYDHFNNIILTAIHPAPLTGATTTGSLTDSVTLRERVLSLPESPFPYL